MAVVCPAADPTVTQTQFGGGGRRAFESQEYKERTFTNVRNDMKSRCKVQVIFVLDQRGREEERRNRQGSYTF